MVFVSSFILLLFVLTDATSVYNTRVHPYNCDDDEEEEYTNVYIFGSILLLVEVTPVGIRNDVT